MARSLRPGQVSRIFTIDVDTGEKRLIHESRQAVFECPNWTLDGAALVTNANGHLYRLSLTEDDPVPVKIEFGELAEINNDHLLDPDGEHIFISVEDGHIYRAPLAGGTPTRITSSKTRLHFLHGVSPDGAELAYIGIELLPDGGRGVESIWTIRADGTGDTLMTPDEFPDDGAEFSPDGEWIYFNTERARTVPGQAQIFRMRRDGSGAEQLTFDERVNWFPHLSPDGSRMVYISYERGTEKHPNDRSVIIKHANPDGSGARELVALFGGNGTINVPSWSPDSRQIAYVEYPIG